MTAPDMTHVVPQHFINDNSHNNVAVAIVLCQPIMSALINQNPVHVNGDDGFDSFYYLKKRAFCILR